MKTHRINPRKQFQLILILLFSLGIINSVVAQQQTEDYQQFKGEVFNSETNDILVSVIVSLENSNISTITNADGQFSLKVPVSLKGNNVSFSLLGFQKHVVKLNELEKDNVVIKLDPSVIQLTEVDVAVPKNAKKLVEETLAKKGENNVNEHLLMTAFYRETIKKRKRNVSIAEAVVNVYKKPYSSYQKDDLKLFKSRKSTDYRKLDTVAVKLQGGPFNPLYGDLMKYPEYIFTKELIEDYGFSFDKSTIINDQLVYVVNFKQLSIISEPRYYGKLYIDSNTHALVSAVYNLNVENRERASEIFVRRRPNNIYVYPTEAAYKVDYREKDGKWYYGYSNVQLTFKVNDRKKIFNSVYTLNSEMAVTDWEKNITKQFVTSKEKMRPSVVISDEASGFSDPEFWGVHNVIEPEKSIETAINKIKKRLDKVNKRS